MFLDLLVHTQLVHRAISSLASLSTWPMQELFAAVGNFGKTFQFARLTRLNDHPHQSVTRQELSEARIKKKKRRVSISNVMHEYTAEFNNLLALPAA